MSDGIMNMHTLTGSVHVMAPNIDYGLCRGCGGCSDAYPQYFNLREERAWVINTDKFSGEDRAGILSVCLYYAISIE